MNNITRLAKLVGFEDSYTNSFGEHVLPKEQALCALLTAMGYNLEDDQTIQVYINQLTNKSAQAMLAPVYIVKSEDATHNITINLSSSIAAEQIPQENEQLHWQIFTESGQELSGKITIPGQEFRHFQLPLPEIAQGYHKLTVTYQGSSATSTLIYAPKTCYNPQEASTDKLWGFSAQLYSLRSKTNWGLGDYSDLQLLVTESARQGAAVIGVNPLHPLFQNNPAHCSPYSPTSRRFLNTLYIDVTKLVNFDTCQQVQDIVNATAFTEKIQNNRASELIDYASVAKTKYEILELLYQDFINPQTDKYTRLIAEFARFKVKHNPDLLGFATFEALFEHFRAADSQSVSWQQWPLPFQHPENKEVKQFQQKYAQRIDYFSFLQWLAHYQLSQVTENINKNKKQMPIGLYLDLAVGCDGGGFDVWSDREAYVAGARIGAPPDALNALGQDWGLTPLNPFMLKEKAYQPLITSLRCNMQYAGALRIDHVLGLQRQYWVAPGMKADEGIYINFPLEDIFRIIALESRRARCVVIGEDLGTPAEGFREQLQQAGLLSYRVLFFERWQSGLFKRAELYPELSMATVSTHDLPTLASWWTGKDLQWRQQLNLYPNVDVGKAERESRACDRQQLIAALEDLSVIDMAKVPCQCPAAMNRELTLAVQKYLAQTPSYIQLIPLEDALEIAGQVNIPGTTDEHPNWRQKLTVSLEDLWQTRSMAALTQTMQQARPNTRLIAAEQTE